MSNPIAWLVEEKRPPVPEYAFRKAMLDETDLPPAGIAEQYTITPLVAAPSPQTVEEVTQAIDNLIVAVRNTESCGDPYHDWRAADAALAECRADLIALVAGAAPPEGAPSPDDVVEQDVHETDRHAARLRATPPTYAQLVEALGDLLGQIGRDEYYLTAAERARDLLSRIPTLENAK